MKRRQRIALATLAISTSLASCTPDLENTIASLPEAPAPAVSPPSESEGEALLCPKNAFAEHEWRELGNSQSSLVSDSEGLDLTLRSSDLPPTAAERYNAGVEVCPGILLVIAHEGTSRFIAIDEMTWSEGPRLSHSGSTERISADGVNSGGPTWGIRDAVLVEDALVYADAVIDTTEECVRLDVHRIAVSEVIAGNGASTVIASTTPCVDYTEPQRAASAIRTHMGAALAWDEELGTLYLTVGDFHLGASTIGQAAGIGLEGTLRDYAILGDPSSMVGSVVAIEDPLDSASVSIVAKGLRNSLGLVVVPGSGLWLSDHGPSGGDELNLMTAGSDYGWPLTSAGKPYDRAAWPRNPSALLAPWLDFENAEIEGTTPPVLTWTPAIAPTELALYLPGEQSIDAYEGLVLLSSLRAQSLFVLEITATSATQLREILLGERIRNLTITGSGQITMLTDSSRLLVLSTRD